MRLTHHSARTRGALGLLAASALTVGALAGLPAQAASGADSTAKAAVDIPTIELDGTTVYACAATAAGLPLGTHNVAVHMTSEVAALAPQGSEIPETEVDIALTMPESLRSAAVDALGVTEAEGSSSDSTVEMNIAGHVQNLPLNGVSAPRAAVPQSFGQPWEIDSSGTTDAATVPPLTGNIKLSAPSDFSVDATLYKANNDSVPTTLDCHTSAPAKQKLLGIIPIATSVTPGSVRQTNPMVFGCQLSIDGSPGANAGTGVVWAYPALPTAALAGSTWPGVPQVYVLAPPEAVRSVLYDTYQMRTIRVAGGQTSMDVVAGATTTPVALSGLASAPTPIPSTSGTQLLVQSQGALGSWTVPSRPFTLRAGSQFQVALALTDAANNPHTGTLGCKHIVSGTDPSDGDPALRKLIDVKPYTGTVAESTTVTTTGARFDYGQGATVTATVSPTVTGGTVSIYYKQKKLDSEPAAPVAVAKVVDNQAVLTLPAKSVPAGKHALEVRYSGDATHKSAFGTSLVRIAKMPTQMSSSVSPETIVAGKTHAVVTANVSAESAEAKGVVQVYANGRLFGQAQVKDGVATIRLRLFPTPGERTLRITYKGTRNIAPVTTRETIDVV